MLERYARFVVNNAAQVSSIENGLRTLTYVLPGRFADAEVASEAVYTLVSFIGTYHDGLLGKAAKRGLLVDKQGRPVDIEASAFNRYHGKQAQRSDIYRVAARLLSALQFSEKLVEMVVAKRLGERARWRAVTWIEIMKAALRMVLLQTSGRRMVTGSVVQERMVDPGQLGSLRKGQRQPAALQGRWRGGRSGVRFSGVRDILSKSEGSASLGGVVTDAVRHAENVAPMGALVKPYGACGMAGELLFILRPLLYVLAMRRLGARSWRPWAGSLAAELVSRWLVARDLGASAGERSVEHDEVSRRKRLLLYYLLRSPFFDRFTRGRLERVASWCSSKPLLSLVGSLIQDYQPLWRQYYFYTAAS
ncbi:hypothetical protein LPJ66_006430 [Kickxella alabastrina]|uniref:Uncharacterized protein n=1 Tax=Kickxella alabastrina TaxID=61397 RepID=A0ACC1IBL9_9FUNG|nr:hypothetical protein LPJ66_006430 [Kickxella alabastrina]